MAQSGFWKSQTPAKKIMHLDRVPNATNLLHQAAIIRMFESAWFGQGEAFWAWIETPDALPYITDFAKLMTRPRASDTFDFFADDEPDRLHPDHLDALRIEIERNHGQCA